MDDRELSIPPTVPGDHVDAEAAPAGSVRESAMVTFSGSAERISEGFALALRAMGAGADILPVDPALPDARSNLEDS